MYSKRTSTSRRSALVEYLVRDMTMKKIYLVPLRFRMVAGAVRRVAIAAGVFTAIGLLIMAVCGVFQDVTTAVQNYQPVYC